MDIYTDNMIGWPCKIEGPEGGVRHYVPLPLFLSSDSEVKFSWEGEVQGKFVYKIEKGKIVALSVPSAPLSSGEFESPKSYKKGGEKK